MEAILLRIIDSAKATAPMDCRKDSRLFHLQQRRRPKRKEFYPTWTLCRDGRLHSPETSCGHLSAADAKPPKSASLTPTNLPAGRLRTSSARAALALI